MTSINANIGFKAFPQATLLLSCSIIIRNLRVHQSYTYSTIFFMLVVSEFPIFKFSLTIFQEYYTMQSFQINIEMENPKCKK